jgi:tripartite-type tricarboxylate transporter receptor subunit TctC
LLGAIGPIAINVSLFDKVPYNPATDLIAVTQAVNTLNVLVVNPSLPVTSVRELIAYAKTRPGQLNFASTGAGQTDHLAGELFNTSAGVKIVHVPYKGAPSAMQDLLGGNVQVMFATVSTAIGQIKANKVRPLAMTGSNRSSLLPELPTIAEAGVPGYVINNWYGIFVPAGTPTEIVATLNADIGKVLNMPDVKQRLLDIGIEPAPTSSEQFAAYVAAETKKWAAVVKQAGAKVD